jgi:ATP-dependent RNA helicase DeaD
LTVTFEQLELTEPLSKAINKMGFEEATPIQGLTIPLAKEGKDLIGQAQTGTGKTAAFGIPMIEKFHIDEPNIQGLVVTPTRELAIQVAEELNKIGEFKGVRALPIYGGQEIFRQIKALKRKPHIIVGTPGRLLDHIRRRTVRLGHVGTVVLDEADEMLNMGFIEDIESILKEVPGKRQTLLFSATMPGPIQKLAEKFMEHPEVVRTKSKEMTVPNIEQQYFQVHEKQKFDVLCRLLDIHAPDLAIVFGRTKRRVDELDEALNKRGYSARGLHGDLNQARRDRVMGQFKNKQIEILIATDVASRGLDISGVTHVFNFDIPQDPESYVHRVGRTGRAGNAGLAVTFITPREGDHLKTIERLTKHKITQKQVPTFSEAIEGQQKLAVEKLLETAGDSGVEEYKDFAENLLEKKDSVTLLSAALKMITKEPDMTPVKLTGEAPLSSKKPKNRRNDSYKKRDRRPQGSFKRRGQRRKQNTNRR